MTTIHLLGTKALPSGYEVSGHSGAGTEGNDIVCAAISFLAITCANALESVAGLKPQVTQKEAYLKVFLSQGQSNHESSVILRTFRQGAEDLQQTYPQYVRLKTPAEQETEEHPC
jgi:uncharacterized protein YsxB (DUF464 family)